MAYTETPLYTGDIGASVTTGQTTLDRRRKYAFGDGVAELMPTATPLFSLATKYAKVPTNDPIFKMLEKRHIYQRRQFYTTVDPGNWSSGSLLIESNGTDGTLLARYDANGVAQSSGVTFYALGNANWLPIGTVVGMSDGIHSWMCRVTANNSAVTDGTGVTFKVYAEDGVANTSPTYNPAAAIKGQVIGSTFAEATGAGAGWADQMLDTEGYTQIFKTPTPMISGTGLATELRGIKNRFIETYKEALASQKLDIENASVHNVGYNDSTNNTRYTHGGLAYIGDAHGHSTDFTYGGSGYDDFVEFLKEYMTPENGLEGNTRIAFVSRDIIAWLNKIGSDAHSSFLKASFASSGGQWNLDNVVGAFGLNITKLTTPFGALGFINHPMLREDSENKGLVVDFNHIKMRPLQGNGINRDTSVYPHVEDNDADGRVDLIMTELGFEWDMPETHHRLIFS